MPHYINKLYNLKLKPNQKMLHPDPKQRLQASELNENCFDDLLDLKIDDNILSAAGRTTMSNASFYLNYGHQVEKSGKPQIGDSELWAQFSATTSFMRRIESFIQLETGQTLSLNFYQILDTLLFCLSPRINKGTLTESLGRFRPDPSRKNPFSGLDAGGYGDDELLSKYDQYSDVYVLFVRIAYGTRLCQAGWKQMLNIRNQIQACIERGGSDLEFDQIKVGIKKYSLQDAIRERAHYLSIMIAQGGKINRAIHGVIDGYEGNKFKIQIFDQEVIKKEQTDFIFIPFDSVKVEDVLQKFANKYATKLKRTKPTASDSEIKEECLRIWYDQNIDISANRISENWKDSDFYIKGIGINYRHGARQQKIRRLKILKFRRPLKFSEFYHRASDWNRYFIARFVHKRT